MLQCQLMMTIRAYVRCTLCVHQQKLRPSTHHFLALFAVLLEMMVNVETDSFATNNGIMNTPESSRKKKARTISSSLIIVLLVTSCIIWSIFSSSSSSLKAPSQRRMLREYGADYRPIMHTFCK